MALNEAPSVSVTRRGSTDPGSDPLRIVVQVRGEHDVATRPQLSAALARAARRDDAGMVVDLSAITFMDASTIGAIVLAHNHLRARSRSLCVRDPSPLARRLLDVCDLGFLIDDPARRAPAAALDSWVAVPASDPASEGPARAAAQRPRAPADPVQRLRTPS